MTDSDTELDRAREYQRMMGARAANKDAAERALKGDPELRRQLQENWNPLLRDPGWDPPRNLYEDD